MKKLIILNIGCDKESSVKILTHCNTGSLATGGYGTALGVIRALQDLGRLHTAFCTETRFYEIESVEKVDFKSDNSSKDITFRKVNGLCHASTPAAQKLV